ncbi:hypothetical protein RHOFW510R12_00710 [Rhodanobacter sp. FW510-R12]|uniref:hypothetical protein n=1 Tax=Rhodanobacter thiooxydans TaxID=416169 RepID=UPI00092021F6|nr:hypothetical protein [Rhodanobacter thiooxydans]UJJ56762.1 hypothetical protein LRK53_18265 [Rhodanobacter thiooxydans]
MTTLLVIDHAELEALRHLVAALPGAALCGLILAAAHALNDDDVSTMVADEMGIEPEALRSLQDSVLWTDDAKTSLRDVAARATGYHD